MNNYPSVQILELGMREGMQIESAAIPTARKIELLDALSRTGLKHIQVGSFVSPKYTPQMAEIDDIVQGFSPNPGVEYSALALNERGRERWRQYVPPLAVPESVDRPRTSVQLCDVFARRNVNRTQQEEIDSWPRVIAAAQKAGSTEAAIAIQSAWGSNWLGEFSEDQRLDLLDQQYQLWMDAGIPVREVRIADPMGWNLPDRVEAHLKNILERWPSITTFQLHLHNTRGTAMLSAYTALRTLDTRHTLVLDSSIGGMGGCPYCGNGQATGMIPTEDLVDLLEELGIPTGVNLDLLIEAAILAEDIVGRRLDGHLSKAGVRPRGEKLYPMDLPFIETLEQAQHFRLGKDVYQGALSPWTKPIQSPARDALES
ncbi:hydroxymethylglutaryl-CoA lyase [Arthrobacter sp. CAN_A214]|uniref:citramalate synthase n=1 Tax=Arthrobacter sp. CAN_A214 TaxID=2787720 RepID=UPI0018C9810A